MDESFREYLDEQFASLRSEMATLDREHRVLIEDVARQVRKVAEGHGILLHIISDVKLAIRDDIHDLKSLFTLSQKENNRRITALEQHVGI